MADPKKLTLAEMRAQLAAKRTPVKEQKQVSTMPADRKLLAKMLVPVLVMGGKMLMTEIEKQTGWHSSKVSKTLGFGYTKDKKDAIGINPVKGEVLPTNNSVQLLIEQLDDSELTAVIANMEMTAEEFCEAVEALP